MDFLEKLDFLMKQHGYNKSTFSQACGIPYTTISNWYKRGYDGLQLSTVRKISSFFNTSLEYWAKDDITDPEYGKYDISFDSNEIKLIQQYRTLDDHGKDMVDSVLQKESDRIVQASKIVPLFETEVLMDFTTPVSAGAGIIFEKAEHNDLEVVSNIYTRKADYTLTVSGNSMLPRFKDGDRILVQETEWIEIGEIGVFWYDGRSYVKQLGHNRLISLNPDYHDIYLENYFETRCEGRVIGVLDPDWIVK